MEVPPPTVWVIMHSVNLTAGGHRAGTYGSQKATCHDKCIAVAKLEPQLAVALQVVAQQKVAGGTKGGRACERRALSEKSHAAATANQMSLQTACWLDTNIPK